MSRATRKSQRRPSPAAAVGGQPRRPEGGTLGSGEFKPDYSYVIKDLKRIGLLAGSLILGLIVLSFFMN